MTEQARPAVRGAPPALAVLLVEDNPGDAELVRVALGDPPAGVSLRHVETLSAAMAVVAAGGLDAVLLDLSLPDASGLEGLRRLVEAASGVPILVLTGVAEEALGLGAVQAGAQDFLVKGEMTGALLTRALRYAVERHEHVRRAAALSAQTAARELAQQRAAALDATLSAMADGVVVYDHQERIVRTNPAALAVFGFDPKGLTAIELAQRLDLRTESGRAVERADMPGVRARREALVNGAVLRQRLPGGHERLLETTAAPLPHAGGELGAVAVWRDVTERESLLAELARKNEALAEADRRKDHFLAMLGHELRNPLAPIANSLHVLERADRDSPAVTHARGVIARQVEHMTRLVGDLLDVTRVSRGMVQLQRETVDVCALVRRTVDDYRGTYADHDVALELHCPAAPVYLRADPTRLTQIVGNVLHNSAKFTPSAGRVTVAVVDRGDDVEVSVRDTGIGIAAEMLPRVFHPFAQADRTLDRSPGGLGLGLALVHSLVELHGGTVRAHSDGLGRGTEITLRLPAGETRPAPAPAAGDSSGSRPRSILIIEDNVDAAATLKDALELSGHEVAVAHGGDDGLEQARARLPEVVLCDIGLPGMDGYEVARAMRQDPALGATHLVALTGYALDEDRRRARDAGFDLHLAKPPDLDALERHLRELPRAHEVMARPAS